MGGAGVNRRAPRYRQVRISISAVASQKFILAGDIGGTKTNLALYALQSGKLQVEAKETFRSTDYSGLKAVLEEFRADHAQPILRACFGVAGPVLDGKVKTPNLPWVIRASQVAKTLKLKTVALLNDLEATAYGIFTLKPRELFTLNAAKGKRPGNKALIAAGTGLGEATLFDNGDEYFPSASEGGHGDFAPRNEIEIELLRYLFGKFGHVSYERILSGPGLWNIYEYLKQSGRLEEPRWLNDKLAAANDRSAVVTQLALAGESTICERALEVFVSVYGAEAGNLALRAKATGGIYLGGGIAPKILGKLKERTFMSAFVDKGRYGEFVSTIPVWVILNEEAALQGAAYYAAFRVHG
jgi:glucokinase